MNENLISNPILQELELVFGSSLLTKKWDPVSVPKLLSYGREFIMLENQDGGSKFLLVKEQSSQDWNITAIQKQYSILSKAAGYIPVVFLLSELTSARKASYLRHRIPYITMNNQYFLPFAACKSDGKFTAEVPDKINSPPLPSCCSCILCIQPTRRICRYQKHRQPKQLECPSLPSPGHPNSWKISD